jgi:hypothetical protein
VRFDQSIKAKVTFGGPFLHFRRNVVLVASPLSITGEQLRRGPERIDAVLTLADEAARG